MRSRENLSLAIVFILAIAGCTKKESRLDEIGELAHRTYEGEILKAVTANYESPAISQCDLRFKDRVIKLAKHLDSKKEEIQKRAKESSRTGENRKVPSVFIGKHRFYDYTEKPNSSGWQEDRFGWQDIFDKRDELDIEVIDNMVRSLIPDEEDRLQKFFYPKMSRANGPVIKKIFEKVAECHRTECTELNLTGTEESFLSRSWFHRTRLEYIRIGNEDDRKIARDQLFRKMRGEAEWYNFRVNPNMSQIRPGVFVLKMNAGDFAGGEQSFPRFMRYWETAGNKVILETKTSLEGLYKFVMHMTSGRAFVNHEKRTVNLYDGGFLKTIAHEVGHVMGFRDTYYSSFDFKNCEYVTELNVNDIMSYHRSGRVMPEHWKTLKEKYPLSN